MEIIPISFSNKLRWLDDSLFSHSRWQKKNYFNWFLFDRKTNKKKKLVLGEGACMQIAIIVPMSISV